MGGKEEALNSIRSWPVPVHPHQQGALNPLINSYMTGLIPQNHDSDWHLNEGAGASLLQAPFHGCALCPLPPTPPHRVETSPFSFRKRERERATAGRYREGLSSCPTAPQSVSESLPTKTGLLHIPHFCIWMSGPLSGLKCTLNLSGNNREEAHTFSSP